MSALALESTVRGSKVQLDRLPSVDRILKSRAVAPLIERHGRSFVTREARALLKQWREEALRAKTIGACGEADVARALSARIEARLEPALRPVFNLTGTVLHTNLGRAVLADEAIARMVGMARSPANLEFDLAGGARGDRDALVEELVCELTGAQAATVVNNNAAAVLLTIAALASRREVVISRGELVEIGGAFRMPDVMKCAGARMVEVGTTNRTHPRDYVEALTPRTALIMKVHTSNYVVRGFTASVDTGALAQIAHPASVPLAIDLGSGSLVDLSSYGLPREPLPQEALEQGADVVTFSGDKLLGGPQAGLIVGTAACIARIRKHPLKRALRVSKLTLSALEATLALYRHPETLGERLPTLRLLTRSRQEIAELAQRVGPAVAGALGEGFVVEQAAVQSQIGSGSLPGEVLPSVGLCIRCRNARRSSGWTLQTLAGALRALPIPVIGRIADDALLLDLRTLTDEDAFVAQLPKLRLATP
ncbi:MAG TPA: L-seryl-tRNA(Sec) selenium transferase [Casimicrobiaceae bacterium]|nr:L-seryl-tRNA(Sec) selenium transferase [Casimicrobiaceae bacterium]